MDFLKKHYEKILLGLMLLGLIGVLVFMLFFIASETDAMNAIRTSVFDRPVHALTNLDTTLEDGALTRLQAPYLLDFETTNKLLNPMDWQRGMDGQLIETVKKTGPQVAVVTNIVPLYYIVSLDSVINNELGSSYVIKVERQAAPKLAQRQPSRHYVAKGDKANDVFALVEVKGPPDNPDSLGLKLVENNEIITISKDQAYRRVAGYLADFRYDPEKKAFHAKRVNDKVSFGGVDYTVVDINQNELILMDQSNQKKTSLSFAP
jgi:hypothetical protein